MIYAQNQSITGINIQRKIIDRVYHGNRLVWLRNSTADSFTIVGDDTIVETGKNTFRIKYAGSDDLSYKWTFSNVSSSNIHVSYNHNRKKAYITVDESNNSEYLYITVVMNRRDKAPLTATKRVDILERRMINYLYINDVTFDLNDSSVYVPLYVVPSKYRALCTIVDASVGDDRLLAYYPDNYNLYIKQNGDINSKFTTTLDVTITDGYIIPYEDFDPTKFEMVNSISEASGEYDEIYVVPVQRYYEKNNLGKYEEYGIMTTVADLSGVTYYTGKLVINSTNYHEYKYDGSTWVDLGSMDYDSSISAIKYNDGDVSIPIKYHWGTDYYMSLVYMKELNVPKREVSNLLSATNNSEFHPSTPIMVKFQFVDGCAVYPSDPSSTTSNICNWSGGSTGFDKLDNNIPYELTIQRDRFVLTNLRTGETKDTGDVVHITGWYDGFYEANVELNSVTRGYFCELSVYDANGNVVHMMKPAYMKDKNNVIRYCIYDEVSHEKYFSTTNDPTHTSIGIGERVPIENYGKKYPAEHIVRCEDGWTTRYSDSATVSVVNPLQYFTIDDASVGGVCMANRINIGVICVSSAYASKIEKVSIVVSHLFNPPKYGVSHGLYEADAPTPSQAPYAEYGSRLLAENSNGLEVNKIYWLQYPSDDLSFIPTKATRNGTSYIKFVVVIVIDGHETIREVEVNRPYNSIDNKYAIYVLKIDGTDINDPSITFDTSRSSVVSCK